MTDAVTHRAAPSRSSACGGSAGASAACTPCATSISTSRTASAAPSSGRTAPGRRRCSTSSPATSPPTLGHDRVPRRGRRRGLPPPYRAKLGMSRTYQKSRLFLGLTVEDNLYLAVLGVARGHLRPVVLARATTARCASARATLAASVGLERELRRRSSARSRTASSASSRSAWRRPANPKLMMLDEPASGLSRGERVALTDLLLAARPARSR